jgi:hypothetical protein
MFTITTITIIIAITITEWLSGSDNNFGWGVWRVQDDGLGALDLQQEIRGPVLSCNRTVY